MISRRQKQGFLISHVGINFLLQCNSKIIMTYNTINFPFCCIIYIDIYNLVATTKEYTSKFMVINHNSYDFFLIIHIYASQYHTPRLALNLFFFPNIKGSIHSLKLVQNLCMLLVGAIFTCLTKTCEPPFQKSRSNTSSLDNTIHRFS